MFFFFKKNNNLQALRVTFYWQKKTMVTNIIIMYLTMSSMSTAAERYFSILMASNMHQKTIDYQQDNVTINYIY